METENHEQPYDMGAENFENQSLAEHAIFLIRWGQIEIHSARAARLPHWQRANVITLKTGDWLYRILGFVSFLTFVGSAIGVFFLDMHWLISVVLACGMCFLFVRFFTYIRGKSIVRAASLNSDAFRALWDLGLFAISIPGSPGHYSSIVEGTRWQDVINFATGDTKIVPRTLEQDEEELMSRIRAGSRTERDMARIILPSYSHITTRSSRRRS